jgi:cupin 2 domain-containing protein
VPTIDDITRRRNLFGGIPRELPTEFSESLLETTHLRLERIVSRGHRTPPGEWYDQDRDEWVLLVEGSALLRVEGAPDLIALQPGDHLRLRAHVRHRVEWTPAERDTVWIALHFAGPAPP